MIFSFTVLKYFLSGKISFFLFAYLWQRDLKPEKMTLFSETLTHTTVGFLHKKDDGFWLEFALFGN